MNNLIIKTIAGFTFLMLLIALSLFIPAGTLSYWQAWAYLAAFGGSTIVITLYLFKYDQNLLAGRVKAGPVAETQKSQRIIQSFANLFFIGIYIVCGLDFRFRWSDVPPVVSTIADVLVIGSFYIVFLVFRENTFTRGIIEISEEQKVISTGPYRWVRHPMYAGASLLLLSTPLALGSWVAIPFSLAVILVVAIRSIAEEKFLVKNLAGYAEYCQKVRYRLIPNIW